MRATPTSGASLPFTTGRAWLGGNEGMKICQMGVRTPERTDIRSNAPWIWALAAAGFVAAALALSLSPHGAHGAASQTWTPFVLVAGLLLVGLVAEEDGLFRAAGAQLARLTRNDAALFGGGCLLIVVVTATLNLDTSVVFLTPVLVAAARQRGMAEGPLLYGSLFLANASSLYLPGSNLTNLIVLGHHPLSGRAFLALMWPAALSASLVTAGCIGVWARRDLRGPAAPAPAVLRPTWGVGALAVILAVSLVLALGSPALPVLAVGVLAVAVRIGQHRARAATALEALGVPVLVGLFGITIGLGTVGRIWSGPATLLAHAGSVGSAVVAAVSSVLCNNLPAASLLAARHPPHAPELLVGLNLGPNLLASGSLAWFLWLKVARKSGAAPSLSQASRLGAVVVPLSIAAALTALALAGST
jgi:arsenical pump membrane protein